MWAQLLLAAAVHECGHLFIGRLAGIPLRGLRLTPLGAVMAFDFSHTSYLRETAVHLGGAGFGLASALLARALLGSGANTYLGITLAFSFVNLLPLEGLDGGGALRSALLCFCSPNAAEKGMRVVSFTTLLLFWTGVLWIELRMGGNLGLILFAVGLMLGKGL